MRASRLISLVLLLQSRETMTAGELAGELGVSERTIYRDVMALSAAGVPVYAEQGRMGGYRLLDGYRTRLTGLSRAEAEALFLAGLPGPARDMGLADAVATAQLKVVAALPSGLRDASSRAAQRFHLDAPGWFQDTEPPPLLAELAHAVWQDQTVVLRYRRRDVVTRTVEPYGLVLKSGTWYLAGRVGADMRVYRVDRAIGIDVTGPRFVRNETFDLAGFWADRAADFVHSMLTDRVMVRLSQVGMRMLRLAVEPPAADAAIAGAGKPDEQGWIVTALPVESVDVAYTQLLRLGPEVHVLDPPELRARMRAAAQRLAVLYGVQR